MSSDFVIHLEAIDFTKSTMRKDLHNNCSKRGNIQLFFILFIHLSQNISWLQFLLLPIVRDFHANSIN